MKVKVLLGKTLKVSDVLCCTVLLLVCTVLLLCSTVQLLLSGTVQLLLRGTVLLLCKTLKVKVMNESESE